jgi:CHAD domain-containing protein
VGEALRSILRQDVSRLLEAEGQARALEVEGIHEMRRATRRLRATLRSFRPYLEGLWNQGLRDELRWLSRQIGAARDLQVLGERLGRSGEEGFARGELPAVLDEKRRQAEAMVAEAFESRRYEDLRERLQEAAERPWVEGDLEECCRRALARRIDRIWRKFRRRANAIRRDAPDESYHTVRKRGKDLRSAVEAVRPWMGRRHREAVKRLGGEVGKLIGVLGARQDGVMAIRFLEEFVEGLPEGSEARGAARRWIEAEEKLVEKLGRRARKVWKGMNRRRWAAG